MTFLKRGVAIGLGMLSLAAAPLCAEPFRFPWDPPERPPARAPLRRAPLTQPTLTQPQVRSVLAREGSRMIGAPQRRGGETVAVGLDSDGGRRKFTLDADGRVVDIEILSPREPIIELRRPPERRPDMDGDPRALERPLPGPGHSLDNPADLPERTPVEPAAARPGKTAPVAAPKQPDSADASLSPIKPLHPPGAPRIAPLPQ